MKINLLNNTSRPITGDRRGAVSCNVGPRERRVRLAIGAAAAAAALMDQPAWSRGLLALIAAAGTLTGLTRYCPLNQMLNIDHCGAAVGPVR